MHKQNQIIPFKRITSQTASAIIYIYFISKLKNVPHKTLICQVYIYFNVEIRATSKADKYKLMVRERNFLLAGASASC